jgi:peptidoglycan hydrolase-like protein with peptidoglycan-binding domain
VDFRASAHRGILYLVLLLAAMLPAFTFAQAQTDSSSVPTSTPVVITRTLYVGESGADVSALQQFLQQQGYFTYPTVTGFYGAATWQAVADFQQAHGLEAVGYVGPLTRALVATLSGTSSLSSATAPTASTGSTVSFTRSLYLGESGSDVVALQQFLKQQGYFTYPTVTGYFGPITEAAVKAFQKANNIDPIGTVGPQTQGAIAQLGGASSETASSVATNTSVPCTAPAGLTCIPGSNIIQPVSPGNGYIPGFGGGGGKTTSVAVSAAPAPTCAISASSDNISLGQSTTLSWTSTGATSASLSGIGSVATAGSQSVSPSTDLSIH